MLNRWVEGDDHDWHVLPDGTKHPSKTFVSDLPYERTSNESKRHLSEIEYHVDLMNAFNMQYYGKLWVGSHMQEMTFIFDTGSAWTWIPSSDCPDDQCTKEHYMYQKSSGFHNTNQKEDVKYGIGEIEGYVVNDDISITSNKETLTKDVNFINVYYARSLATLQADGLLGLSPHTNRSGDKSGESVHLLVTEMKKDGVIKNAIFAMYLADYQ